MRSYKPFNRTEIISSNLKFIQDAKSDEIADRLKDELSQPGILTPAGATASNIQDGLLSQFILSIVSSTNISVAAGIAYDVNGERIEVPSGDTTPHNPLSPNFTTVTPSGTVATTTPFSTGNIGVFGGLPDSDLLDVSERYVFIRYLQVVRTKSLPPNHGTASGSVVTPTNDFNKPLIELDGKTGFLYAPQRINGYEVIVAKNADLTVGSQVSGTPVLAADVNAIFIGRYTLTGGPPATGITNLILSDATRPRKILTLRPIEAVVVSSSDPTLAYADGGLFTLQEHASALGTGILGPNNPHRYHINDITGGGLEPANTRYQDENTSDGIIDTSFDRNNPIAASSALEALIVQSPIPATSFLMYVEFRQLDPTKHSIYIDGVRYDNATPQLSSFTTIPTDTQAIVGFTLLDSQGDYIIYAIDASLNTVSLGKILASSPLPNGALPIAKVFWENGVLKVIRRSEFSDINNLIPIDLRSFGTISKPQISTKGLADPSEGVLSNVAFHNAIANHDFRIPTAVGGSLPENWATAAVSGGTITATMIDTVADVTMATDNPGPKSLTGIEIDFGAPVAALDMRFRGNVPILRPNTVYTLTAWAKFTNFSNSIEIDASLLNGANSPISDEKIVNYDKSGQAWQRIAVSLTTTGAVSLTALTNQLQFKFLNHTGIAPAGDLKIRLTKVYLIEGELASERLGPIVRSGEIFLWDKSTTCPPGSVEVTALQGRVPIGAFTGMVVGVSGGTQQTGFIIPLSGSLSSDGSHSHTLAGAVTDADNANHSHAGGEGHTNQAASGTDGRWAFFGSGQIFTSADNATHSHNLTASVTGTEPNHSHTVTINNADIGEYAVLFCRRV